MNIFGRFSAATFLGLAIELVVIGSVSRVPAIPPHEGRIHQRQLGHSASHFTEGKGPVARMEVTNHRNGTASLTFTFLQVPANFEVNKIELSVEQTKPVSPVQGSPSEQVKAAYYTAQISNTTFDQEPPVVSADVRLYHNPREPYAVSVVCLWYSRANSHVEFRVKPKYFDAHGKELIIRTTPQATLVILENRPTVSPKDLRAGPSGNPKDPTCKDQNAGTGG